ncbi:MAG: lipoyl synthase [Actinobacteria bacterium]|nr:lipoyl synthase [Actinomycetota bacterium]
MPGGQRAAVPARKPHWLSVRPPSAGAFRATGELLRRLELHTVCDAARCPNKGECYAAGTATFLILGERCTRSCGFCAVWHGDPGGVVDEDEPRRVAKAARLLGLRHVVITSVTRDDLADGGASQFVAVLRAVRAAMPAAAVEVLVPDFGGDEDALAAVLAAGPEVFNHNLETVPRLSAKVRPGAAWLRSLGLLRRAAEWAETAHGGRRLVKTGLMVGLGETREELDRVLVECAENGVHVVTIGQYLQPRRDRVPVARFVSPEEFEELAARGRELGLRVIAGPFVRSSYRAAEAFAEVAR